MVADFAGLSICLWVEVVTNPITFEVKKNYCICCYFLKTFLILQHRRNPNHRNRYHQILSQQLQLILFSVSQQLASLPNQSMTLNQLHRNCLASSLMHSLKTYFHYSKCFHLVINEAFSDLCLNLLVKRVSFSFFSFFYLFFLLISRCILSLLKYYFRLFLLARSLQLCLILFFQRSFPDSVSKFVESLSTFAWQLDSSNSFY